MRTFFRALSTIIRQILIHYGRQQTPAEILSDRMVDIHANWHRARAKKAEHYHA